MKELSVLIKPASSSCNLRCRYCFYQDVCSYRDVFNYGLMAFDIAEAVINNIFSELEDYSYLQIAFQGGEPTLAGLPFFQKFITLVSSKALAKNIHVEYTIQTNGLLLNNDWFDFFVENDFLVGISLDGPRHIHDSNRYYPDGSGTFDKVMSVIDKLKKNNIPFNILCVLTNESAACPKLLWDFFLSHDLNYIQFIPCLDDLQGNNSSTALSPQSFSSFYVELYNLWEKELEKGKYISIRLFDDIANLLIHHQVTACGMHGECNLQYIIESDGRVYPCDFYVLDKYCLGNITNQHLSEINKAYLSNCFHKLREEVPLKCRNCLYKSICGGGCVRLKDAMYLNGDFCGFYDLLTKIGNRLISAAQFIELYLR